MRNAISVSIWNGNMTPDKRKLLDNMVLMPFFSMSDCADTENHRFISAALFLKKYR